MDGWMEDYPSDGGLMNVEPLTQMFLLQTQRQVDQEQEQFINQWKALARLVGGVIQVLVLKILIAWSS